MQPFVAVTGVPASERLEELTVMVSLKRSVDTVPDGVELSTVLLSARVTVMGVSVPVFVLESICIMTRPYWLFR